MRIPAAATTDVLATYWRASINQIYNSTVIDTLLHIELHISSALTERYDNYVYPRPKRITRTP